MMIYHSTFYIKTTNKKLEQFIEEMPQSSLVVTYKCLSKTSAKFSFGWKPTTLSTG